MITKLVKFAPVVFWLLILKVYENFGISKIELLTGLKELSKVKNQKYR